MKSIVDKLSSRLEKVENGGGSTSGLSKDEVTQLIKDTDPKDHEHEIDDIKGLDTTKFATKDHEHKSSDISDRISEYVPEEGIRVADINPDENLFSFQKYIHSGQYQGKYYIEFSNTLTFKLKYKENTLDCTTSIPNTTFEDLLIKQNWSTYLSCILLPLDYEDTITLELSNIKNGETTYSDVVITCSLPKSKTNMHSQQLMTANAVNGFTTHVNKDFISKNDWLNLIYPVGTVYFSIRNLYSIDLIKMFGGGWVGTETNITTSNDKKVYCFYRES